MSTFVMAQLTPNRAASSKLLYRMCMSLGACDMAMSDTARSREDGMEGLPPTTPSQPEALSSQLSSNWDLLPPRDAPGSCSLPNSVYRTPDPISGEMGCLHPSSRAVAELDHFALACAGRKAQVAPVFL